MLFKTRHRAAKRYDPTVDSVWILNAGTAYPAATNRMRVKRRRAHTAIRRTGENRKPDRQRDGRIPATLCAPPPMAGVRGTGRSHKHKWILVYRVDTTFHLTVGLVRNHMEPGVTLTCAAIVDGGISLMWR